MVARRKSLGCWSARRAPASRGAADVLARGGRENRVGRTSLLRRSRPRPRCSRRWLFIRGYRKAAFAYAFVAFALPLSFCMRRSTHIWGVGKRDALEACHGPSGIARARSRRFLSSTNCKACSTRRPARRIGGLDCIAVLSNAFIQKQFNARGDLQMSLMRMSVRSRWRNVLSIGQALLLVLFPATKARAQTAPVGNGFVINSEDLRFIFHQIEVAQAH